MTFDPFYAWSILPVLLQGVVITFEATIGGMALALVGGLVLALARMSRIWLLSFPAALYVEFVRGTPLLIQLFFIFYVLPRYGISFTPLLTGVVALGLHYSTYISEVYRTGIEGVARGQWEAATALNFGAIEKWRRIVLPQAIRPVIPVLGNYMIGMFKDTPLLATITVSELLGSAMNTAAFTYRYLEPFTLVGLIFFGLSYPSSLLVRKLEAKLAAG
jgi:polar amino acid transport system permease protein